MKKILPAIALVVVLIVGYCALRPEQTVTNARPQGKNIICFGDSLTAGTGADPGMDYPSQLSRLIGRDIINAGVPGDTTASALKRLSTDVLERSPRIVLITLGGNDLRRHIPAETAFKNMETIIESIQDKGALVVVGGIQIPFYGKEYSGHYQKVCMQTGSILIPDILKGILGRSHLMSDPIHPNNQGYAVMAAYFQKAITPYIQ